MRERDMTDRERDEIERVIATWRERVETHTARAIAATDVTNFDRQDSAAYATRLCADDLEALLRRSRAVPPPIGGTNMLTAEDIAQIVEGIENFIMCGDPAVDALWQHYVDKLNALKGEAAESRAVLPEPQLEARIRQLVAEFDESAATDREDGNHAAAAVTEWCSQKLSAAPSPDTDTAEEKS
jgi:hypothetical protein